MATVSLPSPTVPRRSTVDTEGLVDALRREVRGEVRADPATRGAYATDASNYRRVPIGVVGVVYEARPNVTSDIAALCIKTGNAVVLRGGKEALGTNRAIVDAIHAGLAGAGLPESAVEFITSTDRAVVDRLLKLRGYIDVIVPRGGAGLIKATIENATVPVIETGAGVCHTYVDRSTDPEMFALSLEAWASWAGPWAEFAKIEVPTLIVVGQLEEGDEETAGVNARTAALELRDGRAVVLPGLGHVMAFVRSDVVLSAIRAFLDGTDADRG